MTQLHHVTHLRDMGLRLRRHVLRFSEGVCCALATGTDPECVFGELAQWGPGAIRVRTIIEPLRGLCDCAN